MLHLLSDVLMEGGFDVTSLHAEDAVADALELVEPMAIVCDELEGVFNGERLYAELQAQGRADSIAFVLLSDSLDSKRTASCLNAGMEEFISKPFAIEELYARIHKAVRSRQRVSELEKASEVAEDVGFAGRLEYMDLPDLVLNLNQNMRSGVLHVDVEEGAYRFDFSNGELAGAVGPGGIMGRKAFFRAIRCTSGSFTFYPGEALSGALPSELMSAGHLLLSAVQESDEYGLVRGDLPGDLQLSLTSLGRSKSGELPAVLLPLTEGPHRVMSVAALINASPRTDLEAALELLECMKQEVVVGYDKESSQPA